MLVKTFDNELKSKENLVLRKDTNIYNKTIANTQNYRNTVNNYSNKKDIKDFRSDQIRL